MIQENIFTYFLTNWTWSISTCPFLTSFFFLYCYVIGALSVWLTGIFNVWCFYFLAFLINWLSSHVSEFCISLIISRCHRNILPRLLFDNWIQFCSHVHLIYGTTFLMEWLFSRARTKHLPIVITIYQLDTVVQASSSTTIIHSKMSSMSLLRRAIWRTGNHCIKSLFEAVIIDWESKLAVFWISFVLGHDRTTRHQCVC